MAAADEVSEASYRDFLDNWLYTHAGDNRGVGGPEHDLARDNIEDFFLFYGLDVTLEPFQYSGLTYYNVVGTKLGTTFPNQEYIVGAHFDSVSNPGADDNGSGVALVLEAARILTQYDSAYTIRFIAFDREEQGLVGSYAYVSDHIGDDILGMISTSSEECGGRRRRRIRRRPQLRGAWGVGRQRPLALRGSRLSGVRVQRG
jgi:acetylornithine deacetylase/succinyl-diaminopimelate desuccinylase-like protein